MVVGSLLLSVDAVNGSGDGVKNEVVGGVGCGRFWARVVTRGM